MSNLSVSGSRLSIWTAVALLSSMCLGAQTTASSQPVLFKQSCLACHGKAAMGGVNLQQLLATPEFEKQYDTWEKVAEALESKHMPPAHMKQPSDEARAETVSWIRSHMHAAAHKNAGDPGKVTVRRLTSGEYEYTIEDLTGIDWKIEGDFVSDSVGGEGFANFGDVQYMGDANLERYLQEAKRVAAHAVIGAGPLRFYQDPGKSGMELSAINRIQKIYRTYGFSSASGEGGIAYGLDKYAKAISACWVYQHRVALGKPGITLAKLAQQEKLAPQFVTHIWTVLHEAKPQYPVSTFVAKYKSLPVPKNAADLEMGRKAGDDVLKAMVDWPRWLFAAGAIAEGGRGDERALVLNDASLKATLKQPLRFNARADKGGKAKMYFSVANANPTIGAGPVHTMAVWKNATVRFRSMKVPFTSPKPLLSVVTPETRNRLQVIEGNHFALEGEGPVEIEFVMPEGMTLAAVALDVEMSTPGTDAVLRAAISERAEMSVGTPVSALLADPKSKGYVSWKQGVLDFGNKLPLFSHAEPTPSDKDIIPDPFNNTYNQPERDYFHQHVKYVRNDGFFSKYLIDAETRKQLNDAWDDLYASSGYHEGFYRFVADKFKLKTKDKSLAGLSKEEIAAIPAEPRKYVESLRTEFDAVMLREKAAQAQHMGNVLAFAARAWRRPLTASEQQGLRTFYSKLRNQSDLDHDKAIRSVLTRVLVSPSFLYRVEQGEGLKSERPLTSFELASRLSYFLWASVPDQELLRAASAGELQTSAGMQKQVKRMLADGKARRFATEFFGQWLGFYHFDRYSGVDTSRFPEFTADVKSGMYQEAVGFFEYLVRQNRPVSEMFSAKYTFLTPALAKHYGIKKDLPEGQLTKVDGVDQYQRGGVLRLGALMTATSAPLRTSPVKRGDWMLRRILSAPTPPPPPDAGSIPADPKQFGGLSLKEKLKAHQRNATCAGCHTRIDPLGFPFESYDAVGRYRATYEDGKPVDNASQLADKTEIKGVDGLVAFLKMRDQQVMKTVSKKLLGYALGRTIIASDQPLIDEMTKQGSDVEFAKLIAQVVTSRQFRYRKETEVPQRTPVQQTRKEPAVLRAEKEGAR